MIILRMIGFALVGFAALLGVWAGDRNPTTETRSAIAVPAEVKAGEDLHIQYDFRRYRLCPREIERTIFDGDGIRFELGTQSRPYPQPVGQDSYVQPITVPAAARPGPGRYRVTLRDFCNPLHRFWPLTRTIEIPFQILPGMPPPG